MKKVYEVPVIEQIEIENSLFCFGPIGPGSTTPEPEPSGYQFQN